MIIITGASDGLGKELARLYADAHIKVISLSRTVSSTATLTIETDLTQPGSIQQAADKVLAINEPIDALINCAGVMSVQEIEHITEDELAKVFDVNVKAPILLTSKLINRIRQDGSDIVNVASTVGTKAYKDQAAYGASKWALRGFSTNLQLELKDSGCRVISFCTGGFDSKIFEKATGVKNKDFLFSMRPEDVASFIKQILELPKNMEVSEVLLNRKSTQASNGD